ncbi:MAG: AMP-binding protein [Clostridiales bacterium]|nr:AMP-binding protein [Clostridiales bacterium]
MSKIFITGITGFLGTEIVSEIMDTTDDTVYGLVRSASGKEAAARLTALWYRRPGLMSNIGSRIIAIPGDITEDGLGLSEKDSERLIRCTDYVIHTAALIGIRHSREEFWKVNVYGTAHVLDFARRIQSDHPLKRFSHVSTAYVAGTRNGLITEDFLENTGFSSLYEESKFEGESLVAGAMDELPVSIFRPGQIVGDSRTGYVKNFNTLYYPLKLYLKKQTRIFPIKKSMRVNMVPVDYVAGSVVRISCDDEAAGKTFHLTAPAAVQPTVGELVEAVQDWAKKNISMDLPKPLFFPVPFLARRGAAYNMSDHSAEKKTLRTNILALSPYFSEDKVFDTRNTESITGEYKPDWREYLPRLLKYAVDKNFLDDNSRTVYEQICFCLRGRHSSINYYDVTAEGMKESSAASVYELIESALRALQAMGIGPGSRVAISGINCVRYFILDVAIGLSGAASVPLYYTTPADELDELLAKSGADCFFIGDKRILSHADQLSFDKKMISFADGASLSGDLRLMPWGQFLRLGRDRDISPVQVSYDDIATIRYTSGTTGNSKSVAFTHGQLRWMAETMVSLLSLKSRSGYACYLSFLPLSHVVEGILGAYTPYYFGREFSIYFLNDFDRLAETLPKVRPTIFFSVPRFYEKVWDQLTGTGAGMRYISGKSELIKNILRPILRKALLKRAGLDHCDQLIVGSAPVSEKLLADFRQLGIEIHNAYGLTEAPLITLNRLGENDLTTVGPPLPETKVSLADDGEILVSGPQVAAEYDGRDGDCLHTGDVGEITESGHLRIIGRKREILINSYGKNINLQKVETLLKDIPGISEALLVAEGRPYCAALLWPEDDRPAPDEGALTAAIRSVNERLSHPEQIKRYALMSGPLKISTGELTPNLKLRRDNIMEIHKETIDGLYAAESSRSGSGDCGSTVLFTGAL